MSTALDSETLAELLPGTWTVSATNLPMWLGGERRDPTYTYEVLAAGPLALSDDVAYLTAEGEEKHVLGKSTWRHDGFVWRGKGRARFTPSRWEVSGANEDGSILVLRFSKSLASPSGLNIVTRQGSEHPELRATIARSTEDFGLSPEDFASLSWLAPAPRA